MAATRPAAFTLIEMLFVIAIIAGLSALTLPALQGLVGVSGVRGGVNTVLAALDQARAAAIEGGTDVYVGFPPSSFSNPSDPYTRVASLIVFRSVATDENPNAIKPLTRWQRLPSGIAMQTTGIDQTFPGGAAASLPKLAGSPVPVEPVVIRYDRFGRIRSGVAQITVGDAVVTGDTVTWKGNNREILTAQPLTGRWVATQYKP